MLEVELSIYKFKPNTFALKVGEPVQFKATSIAGIHTFTVKDLGIEVDLTKKPKDTKISQVFIPQQAGTFQITCRIHPASSYPTMQGTLEVTQ